MKKFRISKIMISAVLFAMLTACGETSESSDIKNTSETTKESTVKSSETTTEPISEFSDVQSETSETYTEPTSEISVVKSETSETYTEPISEIPDVQSENSETPTEPISEIPDVQSETSETSTELSENSNQTENFQTAYLDIINSLEDNDLQYNLIYFDDDDIPELIIGKNFYISMYTYADGEVYTLIDQWIYGAMGNAGYEYVPGKNSLRNYDNDLAGAICYVTYMSVSENYSLDVTTQIKRVNFDDKNQNDMIDDDERESAGKCHKIYIDDTEISEEDAESYNTGEYEYILPSMTLDEIKSALSY